MNDALGDRMKLYELAEAGRRFMPLLPILARIDGRCFSSFTHDMQRPYDKTMTACMVATTVQLVSETNACMGYTQSDEITLAWHSLDPKSQVWFDGRIAKMTSQLGALATLFFYRRVCDAMEFKYRERLPTFDARVWQVPNRTEGANVFLWREWDCTKNSLTMAASELYSHKELHGKNGADKHEMLFAKGINWNDYPAEFKRGTYVQRRRVLRPFTAEELEQLPQKHEARSNPGLVVERWRVAPLDMPIFGSVENREDVVFEGAEPVQSPERRGAEHD
jgi:tRNA(His) guanylyltransferase